LRKWSLARTKAMSVRPTDVGLGRFRKGGGQRGGGGSKGVKEGQGGGSKGRGGGQRGSKRVKGGGQRGGGGVKEGGGGQRGSRGGGVQEGECQREERKRFEKKDDFNEKSISKRVY